MNLHRRFCSSLVCIDDYDCQGHDSGGEEWGSSYEICLVRSGIFLRQNSAGTHIADGNHALFYHKDQSFQVKHPAGSDRSTVFTLSEMQFFDMLHTFNPYHELLLPHVAVIEPAHQLAHYHLLRALKDADTLALQEMILMLLGNIIAHALKQADRYFPNHLTAEAHAEIVNRVKLVLGQHISEALTLEQIALKVHGSPFWLCRTFKAHTGLPIHQYLRRIRLYYALEWLSEMPHMPLDELSIKLGFYSHSHFTTAFSKHFKMSPSAYRKRATPAAFRAMSKILEV